MQIPSASSDAALRAAVLGSTGSVGMQALEVLSQSCCRIVLLSAAHNAVLLAEQAQGEDASRFGYIADCYFGLGDYERALNYALRFIQSGCVMVGRGGSSHSLALLCLEKLGYSAEDRLAVIADGLAKNPGLPDFYGEKGIVYAEMGRWEEAYLLLKKAIDDFVEHINLPLTTEEDIAKILEQLKEE